MSPVGFLTRIKRLPVWLTVGSALAACAPQVLAQLASPDNYLGPVVAELEKSWPSNRVVNLVFHGHSVPSGYFQTPTIDSLHAYPNLVRVGLAEKFPHAVINVIVTAIGGENSVKGAARFERDVLTHKPDVVLIDYALNDRRVGLERARAEWSVMIQQAQTAGVKVILLTPTPDQSAKLEVASDPLNQHAAQIRQLAAEFHVGLVDSLALFKAELARGTALTNLMSQVNHPNAAGHALVGAELLKWFSAAAATKATGAIIIPTPKPPAPPRINGPKAFNSRPEPPFRLAIPATGERPMTFAGSNYWHPTADIFDQWATVAHHESRRPCPHTCALKVIATLWFA